MITEDQVEQLAVEWFQELGYTHMHGVDLVPDTSEERADYGEVLLRRRLREALRRINSDFPVSAIDEVVETAKVIEKLIVMAKEFAEAAKKGEALGLSFDELAFYDALAENESALLEMGDETLKKIAQELTEKLRRSVSVDWQKRESVRAKMRNMIRIILRRYKYPPDKQAEALQLVMRQAEVLSDEWTREESPKTTMYKLEPEANAMPLVADLSYEYRK